MKEFQGTVGNREIVKFMALTIMHEHLTLLHSNNGFSSLELNVKALRLGITELPEGLAPCCGRGKEHTPRQSSGWPRLFCAIYWQHQFVIPLLYLSFAQSILSALQSHCWSHGNSEKQQSMSKISIFCQSWAPVGKWDLKYRLCNQPK